MPSKIKGPADIPDNRSTGEKLKDWFVDNVMSDPGLSPVGAGVVAGSPGGDKLVQTMLNQAEDLTPTQAAIKFMQLKYPKLMSKIPRGITLKYLPEMPQLRGQFTTTNIPKSGQIMINLGADESNPRDIVGTIGHELTHGAIQLNRNPDLITKDYIRGPSSSDIKDLDAPTYNRMYQMYYNQPAEVQARQGGSTSQWTLLNFLYQYPELAKIFGPMGR